MTATLAGAVPIVVVTTAVAAGTTAMVVIAVTPVMNVAVAALISAWIVTVSQSVKPAGVVKTSVGKSAAPPVVVHSVAVHSRRKAAVASD
ncbi:hypothetical protein D3C86_2058130 [compost metagenome]